MENTMVMGYGQRVTDETLPSVLFGTGRMIFLPVAAGCNVQCAGCEVQAPCPYALVPGFIGKALEPDEALDRIVPMMERQGPIEELCIAGPGETLVSPSTRVVLRVLSWRYPGICRSLWTNGLLLSDQLDDLVRLGLNKVTITINAYSRQTAERLYERLSYRGRNYTGGAAADLHLEKQWLGLSLAKDHGLRVTVHSDLFSPLNEADLVHIAKRAARLGADTMVLTSAGRPFSEGSDKESLTLRLHEKRRELAAYLPQQDLFSPVTSA
jgi:nitrogen fixation protein NifB